MYNSYFLYHGVLSSRMCRVVPMKLHKFLSSLNECYLAESEMMGSGLPTSLEKCLIYCRTSSFDFIGTT